MQPFSILQMGRGSALNKRLFASFLLYQEGNNHYLHYKWGKQFNGVFLIARETSLISGSGFIPAFVVVVVIVVVAVSLFWHSS